MNGINGYFGACSVPGVSRYFGGPCDFAEQASWVIDAVNGSDDSLTGPVKTLTEWVSRMQGSVVNVAMSVDIVGDLITSDNPSGIIRVGASGSIAFNGVSGITTLHSGTFTAVTTCVPSTNTPWSATDDALSGANDWATYIDATYGVATGIRVRAGTKVMWPALNLGSKAVRLSQPIIPDSSMTAFGQSASSISTSDAYVVEQLPKLRTMKLSFSLLPAGDFSEQVTFNDLAFAGTSDVSVTNDSPGLIAAYGCDLGGSSFGGTSSYVNCRHAGTSIPVGSSALFIGGLSTQAFFPSAGSVSVFDLRHMIQCVNGSSGGGAIASNQCALIYVGSLQAFNTHASGNGLSQTVGPGMYLAPYLGSSEVFGLSTVNGVLVGPGGIVGINSVVGKTITGGTAAVAVGTLSGAAWNASNQPVLQSVTTAGSARFAAMLIE